MNNLKIFELKFGGERTWVCATTNIHALKVLCYHESSDIQDFEDSDEIIELPQEKWYEYKIKNNDYDGDSEDWQEKTFEEYMKEKIHPDIIAGTMYE